jgi:hypothetical protein
MGLRLCVVLREGGKLRGFGKSELSSVLGLEDWGWWVLKGGGGVRGLALIGEGRLEDASR